MFNFKPIRMLFKQKLVIVACICWVAIAGAQNNKKMDYTFSKQVKGTLTEVTEKLTASLAKQQFSIITQIEMDKKLEEKLGVKVPAYRILGVCNPKAAYDAIQVEENIGVFLPCKIIIKQKADSLMEVVSVDPNVMMKMLGNEKLDPIAEDIAKRLRLVLAEL